MRIVLAATASLAFLAASLGSARAEKPKRGGDKMAEISKQVDTHLERGIEFYAEKQYELAIVEFRAGYALDPRPDFLFALAQAERLSGDCPTAVVYYQRFLQTDPAPNQAEAARVNMRRCTRALESGPGGRPELGTDAALDGAENAAEPAPPAVPVGSGSPQVSERRDQPYRPWYRDTIGTSLAAGGVVGLGLGTVFWAAKRSAQTAASEAQEYDDYATHIDRARRNRTISILGFAAGTAMAGAAVYRYVTRARKQRQRRAVVVAGPAAGGAFVGVAGSF